MAMQKLPLKIWLVVLLVGLWGAYCLQAGADGELFSTIFGVATLIGCAGLAAGKLWSQYVIYALSLFIGVYWISMMGYGMAQGLWPYPDESTFVSVLAIIPGISLMLVTGACCLAVFRFFRQESSIQAPPPDK